MQSKCAGETAIDAVLSEPSLVYIGTIFHELAQMIIRDSMKRKICCLN